MKETDAILERHLETVAKEGAGWVNRPYSVLVLASISFIEAVLLVPIITDPFLAAYVLARKDRAVLYVVVTTIASVVGGLFAYAGAFWLYDVVITPYFQPESLSLISETAAAIKENTFYVSLVGAVTPVPYTLSAIAAGFAQGSVLAFLLASIIGRGGRYIVVGYLTYHYGHDALAIARRHVTLATIVTFLLVALVVYYKLYL